MYAKYIAQVIETETSFIEIRGLLQISGVCKDIIKQRNNLVPWAKQFSSKLQSFKQALKDFEKSNVENYLKTVFRCKCFDSLDFMYKAFRYYIFIKINFNRTSVFAFWLEK